MSDEKKEPEGSASNAGTPGQADIFVRNVKSRMWRDSIVLSLAIYLFFLLLLRVTGGEFGASAFSSSLAATSAMLIGFSFALSSVCYYFNFLDTKIAYRKYLGLVGYYYALLYSVSLLFVEPQKYFSGFAENFFTPDITLGLISMAFFTFMALISNDRVIKGMGPHRWRISLRAGYVAWALLVVRAWLMEGSNWVQWLGSREGFPPLRFLLSCYVIAIILLRASVEISKRVNTRSQKI